MTPNLRQDRDSGDSVESPEQLRAHPSMTYGRMTPMAKPLSDTPSRADGTSKTVFDVLPAVLLSIFAALSWINRAPGMLTRQDDARYIVLGRALQTGSYRDVMWPGAPWHHMYPPGYPALLAFWMTIGGARFDWLVVLQIALSVGALMLMYGAARRALPRSVALGALAILAVSPWYIDWAGQVASEGALAACFGLAIWGATVLPRDGHQVATVILAAALAPLMRAAGLALPAAVLALWISERRFRDVALLLAVVLPIVIPLIAWTMMDPSHIPGNSYVGDIALAGTPSVGSGHSAHTGGGHAGPVAGLVNRIATNARYYLTRALPVLLAAPTVEGTLVDNVVATALIAAGLVTGIVRAWRSFRLAVLLLLVSGGLLLLWPYNDARFVLPVMPALVAVLLYGIGQLGFLVNRRYATAATVATTLVLAVSGLSTLGMAMAPARACARGLAIPPANCVNPDQASFFAATTFIRDSVPAGARVLSAKSEPLYIYSGHPTLPLAEWAPVDSQAFWTGLRRLNTNYILLGALHAAEKSVLAPRLRAHCESLYLVAAFPPHTYLFRVPSAGDTTGAGSGQAGRNRSVVCSRIDDYLRTAPSP